MWLDLCHLVGFKFPRFRKPCSPSLQMLWPELARPECLQPPATTVPSSGAVPERESP